MMRHKMFGRMCIAWMWNLAMVLLLILSGGRSAEALTIWSENFNSGDGSFTVINQGAVESDWVYNSSSGTWGVDGTENLGSPTSSALISPQITILNDGTLTLSFDHRYSFEYDGSIRWDGGQVRISTNSGIFVPVSNLNFTQNGYDGIITGNNVLENQWGFNDVSLNYSVPSYITSVADLGSFSAGDTLQIQFLGAWDEYAKGSEPNWEIDQIQINSTAAVPEPTTMLLLGSGLLGLLGLRSRFKR